MTSHLTIHGFFLRPLKWTEKGISNQPKETVRLVIDTVSRIIQDGMWRNAATDILRSIPTISQIDVDYTVTQESPTTTQNLFGLCLYSV
jgi:hypothetical protein